MVAPFVSVALLYLVQASDVFFTLCLGVRTVKLPLGERLAGSLVLYVCVPRMFGCAWGWSVARYTDCKKCCQENSSHVDTIVRLGSSVNLLGEVTTTPRLVMEMRMNPKYLIYGLIDPRNGQLRYVGKSCIGTKRAKNHAYPGVLGRDRTHTGNWIRGLHAQGLTHQFIIIEVHPDGSLLSKAEIFWIRYFKDQGHNLTNHTDGGEGQLGVKFTDERKLKIARSHGAKPFIDENGNLYNSVRQAGRELGTYHNMISQVLLGNRKSIHGHTFRYV